jgi:hypothetical protein
MNKHTPAPWKAAYAFAEDGIARFIWTATDPVTGHREMVAMIPEGNDNHWDADARLIASAPDLLETLRELIVQIYEDVPDDIVSDHFRDALVAAEAAIYKATGDAQ